MKYLVKTQTLTVTDNATFSPEGFGGWSAVNTGDVPAIVDGILLDPAGHRTFRSCTNGTFHTPSIVNVLSIFFYYTLFCSFLQYASVHFLYLKRKNMFFIKSEVSCNCCQKTPGKS